MGIQPIPLVYSRLKHLVLGRMLYSGYTWDQVVLLTRNMPCLTTLQVHGNNLASLGHLPDDALQSLEELDLDDNQLSDWTEVQAFGSLNGSIVTETERKWAEIDYLKTHGAEYLALAAIEDEDSRSQAKELFMAAHNRYQEVVAKYGEPQQGEGVAVDTTLKSSLMKLKVRSPDLIGSAET